jgi:hypothetical protein
MSQSPSEPRGLRNNNPGNIRHNSHIEWIGQAGADDEGFCIFREAYYGLRALRVLLVNYHIYDDCNTVEDYIKRWAPPIENNTVSYIDSVCRSINKNNYYILMIPDDLVSLMRAIIVQENGLCPYTEAMFKQATSYYPVKS